MTLETSWLEKSFIKMLDIRLSKLDLSVRFQQLRKSSVIVCLVLKMRDHKPTHHATDDFMLHRRIQGFFQINIKFEAIQLSCGAVTEPSC